MARLGRGVTYWEGKGAYTGEDLRVLCVCVSKFEEADLSGVIVEWEKSEKETLSAELFFDRYSGDWNALLRALFSADIKKVSHNVKDLMHTLLENGLPAEGFVFDTALAAYLIDATAGRYDIASLFAVYFHTQLAAPAHLEPGAFDLLGDVRAAETALPSARTTWTQTRCTGHWRRSIPTHSRCTR